MNSCSKRNLVLVLGMAVLLGSFFILTKEVSAKEKVLVMGDYAPINNLDPAASTSGLLHMFTRNIYQGLLRFKYNSIDLEGDLAKSWTVSKDGLVYTFKLRDSIQWHKGFGQVTAHDVKFSFDRVMDPKPSSTFQGEMAEEIKEVRVVEKVKYVEKQQPAAKQQYAPKQTKRKSEKEMFKDYVEIKEKKEREKLDEE